jgi:hypothetical protein
MAVIPEFRDTGTGWIIVWKWPERRNLHLVDTGGWIPLMEQTKYEIIYYMYIIS